MFMPNGELVSWGRGEGMSMVLSKLEVPGRPPDIWLMIGQGPTLLYLL